jgi:hypothetical protein
VIESNFVETVYNQSKNFCADGVCPNQVSFMCKRFVIKSSFSIQTAYVQIKLLFCADGIDTELYSCNKRRHIQLPLHEIAAESGLISSAVDVLPAYCSAHPSCGCCLQGPPSDRSSHPTAPPLHDLNSSLERKVYLHNFVSAVGLG